LLSYHNAGKTPMAFIGRLLTATTHILKRLSQAG
jgi:hypothetical protein